MFIAPEVTYVRMKIVTNRDYLFKRIFHIDIITGGWFRATCSPVISFSGYVYSACRRVPCVTLTENIQGEDQRCRFGCDGRYGLDFVLLEIKRLERDMMQVCEINMK